MLQLMTSGKGPSIMTSSREIIIFTPTPNEYQGLKRHLEKESFAGFQVTVRPCGLGRLNAAFTLGAELAPRLAAGQRPLLVIGAGTAGSLSLRLTSGEVIASASTVFADWIMRDDSDTLHTAYGQLDYRPLSPGLGGEMALECHDPLVDKFLGRLEADGFQRGRLLTSDIFVAGLNHKLRLGREFDCLACDMESGAFAYCARNLLDGLPWLNLRVVADTLDETLEDYQNMEVNMVSILGRRLVRALHHLEELV